MLNYYQVAVVWHPFWVTHDIYFEVYMSKKSQNVAQYHTELSRRRAFACLLLLLSPSLEQQLAHPVVSSSESERIAQSAAIGANYKERKTFSLVNSSLWQMVTRCPCIISHIFTIISLVNALLKFRHKVLYYYTLLSLDITGPRTLPS